jgi:hypothetical protein
MEDPLSKERLARIAYREKFVYMGEPKYDIGNLLKEVARLDKVNKRLELKIEELKKQIHDKDRFL